MGAAECKAFCPDSCHKWGCFCFDANPNNHPTIALKDLDARARPTLVPKLV